MATRSVQTRTSLRRRAEATTTGLAVLALILGSCAGGTEPGAEVSPELADGPEPTPPWYIPALELPRAPDRSDEEVEDDAQPLVRLDLSDGTPLGPATDPPRVFPPPTPLSPRRVAEILARLPQEGEPTVGGGEDVRDTPRPPRGRDPAGPAGANPQAELRVDAIFPAGRTDLAPAVTVVFSEAMVPLGVEEAAAGESAPVVMDPEPPGRWRWLDVRTLRFEPRSGRLPGGTRYRVQVPAGTSATSGARLPEAVEATFATRGPVARGAWPGPDATVDRHTPLLLVFDQQVRPEEVLASARLQVEGKPRSLLPVEKSELGEFDARLGEAAREAGDGQWVALRADGPLPAGKEVRFELQPGLSSAEGPEPSGRVQRLTFRVRDAMEVASSRCPDPDRPCPADGHWWLRFSNPLEPGVDLESRIRVQPEVRDLRLWTSGHHLGLTGDFVPHRSYRIVLDPDIRDRFGQRLGKSVELPAHVGHPRTHVQIPDAPFVTLEPEGPPRLRVHLTAVEAVDVEVFRVDPDDWPRFHRTAWRPARESRQRELPGTLVSTARIQAPDGGRGYSRVGVDLEPAMGDDGTGHAVVRVTGVTDDRDAPRPPAWSVAWVQRTRLGLGVASDPRQIAAHVQSLVDGVPLEGVELTLPGSGATARSDAHGLARLPVSEGELMLVARLGEDRAILPRGHQRWNWNQPWPHDPFFPGATWSVFTDRGLYQPGEEARVHGWIRQWSLRAEDPGPMLPAGVDSVAYRVRWPEGAGELEGIAPVSTPGAFHLRIPVPDGAPSGRARVTLEARGGDRPPDAWTRSLSLRIEEFRRPEYEVRLELDPDAHLMDEVVDVRLDARYFDGPPLPGAAVRWRVDPFPALHQPEGWRGWSFGFDPRQRPRRSGAEAVTHTARADADGVHVLAIQPFEPLHPFPVTLDVRAEVQDLDRQAGSTRTRILVHPAEVYAGLRLSRNVLVEGDTLEFDVVTVEPDGTPHLDGSPRVRVERLEGPAAGASADPEVVESRAPTCGEVEVGGPDGSPVSALRCRHVAEEAGILRVVAEVEDAAGRRARAVATVRVAAGRETGLTSRWGRLAPDRPNLEIELDRDEYEAGDTVPMTVRAPTYPARGTLVEAYGGIRRVLPVTLDGPETRLAIPLRSHRAGVVRFTLRLLGEGASKERVLHGAASVIVSSEPMRLHVEVAPTADELEPGAQTEVEVRVRDAAGAPVEGSEITLWAVDEAVLALSDYRPPDPLREAVGQGWAGTQHLYLADLVRWPRQAEGPGWLTGRLLSAERGRGLAGHVVRLLDGEAQARTSRSGEFALEGVAPGTHTLEILFNGEPVARRQVVVAREGTDVGELLIERRPSGPSAIDSLRSAAMEMSTLTVSGTTFEAQASIALRAPSGPQDIPAPPGAVEPPVAVRDDFSPLAAFETGERTDGDGHARVRFRLPDTATRYRIFAVASGEPRQFGIGEGTVVAKRYLLVRPSFPRFLHPGDRAELTLLVQNLTEADREVEVAARSRGLELEGSGGVRLRVAAGDRREVRLPARASRLGPSRVQAVAVSSELADAAGVTIPVRPTLAPRTLSVRAELGVDESMDVPVAPPPGAIPNFGGLEVALSTSVLAPLTLELATLCHEPELGPSATVARVLGVASVGQHLELLRSDGLPPADELEALIENDVRYLASEVYEPWVARRQRGEGRLPSLHLSPLSFLDGALALHRAAEAGYDVPGELPGSLVVPLRAQLQRTLERDESRDGSRARYRAYWIAYQAYVLRELGESSPESPFPGALARWAGRLAANDHRPEVLAWLMAAFAGHPTDGELEERFRTALMNRVLDDGATATVRAGPAVAASASVPGEEVLLLASRRRTDAVVLSALLRVAPDHPTAPRLMRGLLGHRDWSQGFTFHFEAAWLLAAAGDYVRIREPIPPELRARAWLDGALLADEAFRGRSFRTGVQGVPMSELVTVDGGAENDAPAHLRIEREGQGALLVRAALRWAPSDPFQPPDDRGFVVNRRYEAVDDSADVRRDADGTWRLRAGARVRIRVTLAATARRVRVRLLDPLPAGVEVIHPGLEEGALPDVAAGAPQNRPTTSPPCNPLLGGSHPGSLWANWTECLADWRLRRGMPWHTHRQLRSDRMEAYAALLPAGTYETTYLVRATTPGSFVAAPPRVTEAGNEQVSGRGMAERVVVEERDGGAPR